MSNQVDLPDDSIVNRSICFVDGMASRAYPRRRILHADNGSHHESCAGFHDSSPGVHRFVPGRERVIASADESSPSTSSEEKYHIGMELLRVFTIWSIAVSHDETSDSPSEMCNDVEGRA